MINAMKQDLTKVNSIAFHHAERGRRSVSDRRPPREIRRSYEWKCGTTTARQHPHADEPFMFIIWIFRRLCQNEPKLAIDRCRKHRPTRAMSLHGAVSLGDQPKASGNRPRVPLGPQLGINRGPDHQTPVRLQRV